MYKAAIGSFLLIFLGALTGLEALQSFKASVAYVPLASLSVVFVAIGLFMSTMHLGKLMRFYRGFNNLRHSPFCREGLGLAVFMASLGLHILCMLPANEIFIGAYRWLFGAEVNTEFNLALFNTIAAGFGLLAVIAGLVELYYMNRCYRIKARPFWNHWQVATSFFGNMLSIGSFIAGAVVVSTLMLLGSAYDNILMVAGMLVLVGMLIEAIGLLAHSIAMTASENEGAASHYIQCTAFGKTYILRNALLGLLLVSASILLLGAWSGVVALSLWLVLGALLVTTSVIGRALFYVLVVPTTMPGAFFWKNKGFEGHARDIGLADMPQVGVVPLNH